MLRIGLTGGIGSGKSTAAKYFAEAGAAVFDADTIVAELYAAGRPGADEVRRLFGASAVTPAGAIDKPKLAALVFSDADARRRLEAAIHPLVIAEIRRRFDEAERSGAKLAVAEASQIFEGEYQNAFDRVVLVVSPEAVRLERWRERGLDPEEFARRARTQVGEAEARGKASDVLVNRGSLDDLRRKVMALVEKLGDHKGRPFGPV